MPLYAYQAISIQGSRNRGYLFADSPSDVYQSLKNEGLLLIKCEEHKGERFLPQIYLKIMGSFQRIPRLLLIDFCHQMTLLDEAGVSIDIALEDLAHSTSHAKFKTLLHILHTDVKAGLSLSKSLTKHAQVFDQTFQKLIEAAEKTGNFAPQFRHLEAHLRHLLILRHQIQKSIRSPLILLCLMILLIFIVIDFVIPQMALLLASLGLEELPFPTRLLLCVAPILTYIPLIFLSIGGGLFLSHLFPLSRYYLAKFVLLIPLYRSLALTHFWHVFAVMIESGIDLIPALSQAIEVIKNPYLRDQLTLIAKKITAGSGLSETFSQKKTLISPLMVRLLKLSEQTGRLKELILKASSHHQDLTFRKVETITSWLEPSLILIMGGFMLWIVLAVIIPFYGILGNLT